MKKIIGLIGLSAYGTLTVPAYGESKALGNLETRDHLPISLNSILGVRDSEEVRPRETRITIVDRLAKSSRMFRRRSFRGQYLHCSIRAPSYSSL